VIPKVYYLINLSVPINGTLNHNVKATYVHYLGWFDGNPATLHPLPPEEGSKQCVAYIGGPEEVLRKAREAFDNDEYRWVAEVVNTWASQSRKTRTQGRRKLIRSSNSVIRQNQVHSAISISPPLTLNN
jgi:alkyl sulfatase BDS1-like metallo-beta-lactamase superfamily hydrolase